MNLIRKSLLVILFAAPAAAREHLVYVGTYNGPESKGIYAWRFDDSTGALTALGLAAESSQPSFLARHPNGRFLYSVNESGGREGKVSAFAIDRATGRLTLVNAVSSRGAGPCHLTIDRAGRNVLVANYGSGSVAVLPVSADGRLGEATAFVQHEGSSVNAQRQKGPHAHGVYLSKDERFALCADLGLDKVLVYRFDSSKGTLVPNDPPSAAVAPGSGPRHFAFDPGGKFGWAINEMGNTITGFEWDGARGVLREIETLKTLPADFAGESYTAEIFVHPSGRFLYGSNRGHDSLAVFTVSPGTGRLSLLQHVPTEGSWPRGFGIDPAGKWLLAANQKGNNVVLFRIDPKTGRLAPTGSSLRVGSPVCIVFVPLD